MLRATAKFKARVQVQFAGALHHLEEAHREPNWKEEECLFRALSDMKRGSYKLAEADLLELTGVFASPEKYADLPVTTRERYTIALLRRGLLQLKAEG
jgi:uncharacterized protein YifE (UPF0438 family)